MEFKNKKLHNGLDIVAEVNPSALSAAVGFFVRTGSRDESPQINGVSHFLEHMLFKGTNGLSAEQVNEAFDSIGAKFNAFTSEENTVFYSAVLPEYLCRVTEIWTQLIRPALRQEDFDIEKNVIKEEIAMYKDLPHFEVMDQARALHFDTHPCANSVLGTDQSITNLTSVQMRDYYSNRYCPDNIVVACSGNLDFASLCSLIEDRCGSWQKGSAGRAVSFCTGSKNKHRHKNEKLARQHICLISPAVSAQDSRRFAASLLAMIIGDDAGSRFFWALVDSAIAETASMQYEPMDGVGAFYSYISSSPENSARAMDIVNSTFEELSRSGVTGDELQKAVNKILSAITIKSEQPMGRLIGLGFDWLYLKKYRTIEEDIADIKAVTVDDINALIAEFNPGDYTMLSMGPAES